MVLDGLVDIAVDAFTITEERKEVVDFLQLLQGGKGRLYTKNPRDSYDWGVYTKPLTNDVWLVVILFIIVVPILLMLAMVNCKSNITLTDILL